jgi:hypothetical protein
VKIWVEGLHSDLNWRAAPESMTRIPINTLKKFIRHPEFCGLLQLEQLWPGWYYAYLNVELLTI